MKSTHMFRSASFCLAIVAGVGQLLNAQGLTKDQIIVQALQNQRDEGFNAYLPSPGGLYVNWVYTATPPPNLVNVQSNGTPDPNPATRHDRLTDLEYLADLVLYKQLHPTDTQFDAETSKYTTILQGSVDSFLNSPDSRGWTYWAMLDIISGIPSFDGTQNAQADLYYNSYQKNLTKYGGQVTPIYISTSLDATGTYRVDWLVEEAEVLIENGRSRNLTNYISAGETLLTFAQSHAYNSRLNLWAHQMGHLFTDSTRTTVADASSEYIVDNSVNMGETSELCEAFARANGSDPGKGYDTVAKATLDKLYPTNNALGIWDTSNTGYYAKFNWNTYGLGSSILSATLTATADHSYKEVGRATSAELAYFAANRFAGGVYDITPITNTDLKAYYGAGHGWLYQMNDDFTLYTNGGTPQNWVTSEANGHALRALLTTESASPSLTDLDIGNPGVAGSASLSGTTWTINGSGTDIWSSSDSFNYAYQALPGDGTVTARSATQQNTSTSAKAGVMIRETAAANSAYVFVLLEPNNGLRMQYRATTGGSAVQAAYVSGRVAPYWVRLSRSGSTFTGYYSQDGSTWTQLGAVTANMAAGTLQGMAVTSHANTVLNTTTFDHYTP